METSDKHVSPLTYFGSGGEKYTGILHEVQCTCVLPRFSKLKSPLLYRQEVFSVLENDDFVPHNVICDNCGKTLQVFEVNMCKSVSNKESKFFKVDREKLISELPDDISDLIKNTESSTARIQAVKWVLENKVDGEIILVAEANQSAELEGMILSVKNGKIQLKPFVRRRSSNIVEL